MSDLDVVEFESGGRTFYARRAAYDAWRKAGSPVITEGGALRTYASQKAAWDRYQNGTGSPADNPDAPRFYELGHVRGVAFDIAAANNAAMERAGFIRPFPYEPWHWRLKNLYDYPLVKENDMPLTPEDLVKIKLIVRAELDAERPSIVAAIFGRVFPSKKLVSGTTIPAESFAAKTDAIRRYVTATREDDLKESTE